MPDNQKNNRLRDWTSQLKGNIQGTKDTEMDNFTGGIFDWWRRIDSNDEIEEKNHQLKV